MAGLTATETSFSSEGDFLAHSNYDGTLKIWETTTGNPLADFSPSKHLTATCTCVQWGPGRHLKSAKMSKKKKRKKSLEVALSDLNLIAMGATNGSVLLYSFARGQLHTQLDNEHTDRVTDVCWHPDGTTLYSCSLDGYVVEWDVASSKAREKWKASSSGVHSLCLCSSSRLLTADRSIKMWDLATKTVVQKFTGHSTEVFRLLAVPRPPVNDEEDGETVCSYFLSAAVNDRVINAWYCHPDSTEKNAITSFSLTEEPAELSLAVSKDQMLTLAIRTVKGKVLMFEHTLNGKLKKPLKAKTVIHAATPGSKEEVPVPVPILAALPRVTEDFTLLVAHGSALKPKFETVSLRPSKPEIVLIVSSAPKKSGGKGDFNQVKTPDTSGGSVLYPSQMAPQGPGKEAGARRKRKQSASELTLEDRLQAMGVGKPEQSLSSPAKIPKPDQLVIQLTQGLQSKDAKMLTNAFQERQEGVIVSTVKRLPLTLVVPLIKELCERMAGHPQSGLTMIKWLKQIMFCHSAFLTTIPEGVQTLEECYQMIEFRNQTLQKRMAQQGRMQMLLSRISVQVREEEEPAAATEALLTYQDESSDEEVVMDLGASESEDNWEDDDAD